LSKISMDKPSRIRKCFIGGLLRMCFPLKSL
jgi:hypothetical protein